MLYEIWENLLIALRAIRVNKMRGILTTLGIIIGITSVTSMVTVLNGIERGFNDSLSQLGADVLYVEKWPWAVGPGYKWWKYINRPRITEDLAEVITARSNFADAVAPVARTGRSVQFGSRTVTRVGVEGSTGAYDRVHTVSLDAGRFYNILDDRSGRSVAVLGFDVAEQLFPTESPLGKTVRIGGNPFLVIGVMEKKGDGPDSGDRDIKIPYTAFRRLFGTSERDISIHVRVRDAALMTPAADEIVGIMRAARGLEVQDEDDFVINQMETLQASLAPVKTAIFATGIFLTALSLLVGGIGVMNIMFVSVRERTKEIGIRKAVGARRRTILTQFLIEAVVICLIGGAVAVVLALGLTRLISLAIPAYLPFSTIVLAFAICILIGITFGLAPAWNAARAEPIDALRYE